MQAKLKSRKLLITRPEHDPGTRYLSRWSQGIIQTAEDHGFEVVDLHREKANRLGFEGRVEKTGPGFIILNGHGSSRHVGGHDNEPLVCVGENEKILQKRITYAVACESAAVLGQCCSDRETAYIGYEKSFIININRQCLTRPLKDQRAARFMKASNMIPLSIIKGHTAGEAVRRSKEEFKRNILELLPSTNSDPDASDDVKTLFWDMKHQVCLGNDELKVG